MSSLFNFVLACMYVGLASTLYLKLLEKEGFWTDGAGEGVVAVE